MVCVVEPANTILHCATGPAFPQLIPALNVNLSGVVVADTTFFDFNRFERCVVAACIDEWCA